MRTFFKGFLFLLIALVVTYFLGPKATIPVLNNELPTLDIPLGQIEQYITDKEAQVAYLKPGNASLLVWADSIVQTEYSVVYLHGFSASPKEGDPLHLEIAERYGANFYAPRLAGHGLSDPDAFKDLTVEALMDSAKEAIAIGKLIGQKVLLVSCSTGSTLGLFLSAGDPDIAGHVLYSPNIDIHNPQSELLVGPWALKMLQYTYNGNFREFEAPGDVKKYWTHRYRVEGVITLKTLLKATMKDEVFEKITQPLFLGYWYKNEEECDQIISIPKARRMFKTIATPAHLKKEVAFDKVGQHVIASKYWSEDLESVRRETFAFLDAILVVGSK